MLNTVYVKFKDEKYNYYTSVNAQCSLEELKSYFIGKYFNLGVYPIENMQKCIKIDFYDWWEINREFNSIDRAFKNGWNLEAQKKEPKRYKMLVKRFNELKEIKEKFNK